MHKETSHTQIREAILYPPFPILWMLSLVLKWYLISRLCDIALPIHHQHPTLTLILASTGPQTVTSIQNVKFVFFVFIRFHLDRILHLTPWSHQWYLFQDFRLKWLNGKTLPVTPIPLKSTCQTRTGAPIYIKFQFISSLATILQPSNGTLQKFQRIQSKILPS